MLGGLSGAISVHRKIEGVMTDVVRVYPVKKSMIAIIIISFHLLFKFSFIIFYVFAFIGNIWRHFGCRKVRGVFLGEEEVPDNKSNFFFLTFIYIFTLLSISVVVFWNTEANKKCSSGERRRS